MKVQVVAVDVVEVVATTWKDAEVAAVIARQKDPVLSGLAVAVADEAGMRAAWTAFGCLASWLERYSHVEDVEDEAGSLAEDM